MRITLDNVQEVYHVWAHQGQAEGRSGNASFNGPWAYSYSALIGEIVTNSSGETAFLVTIDTFSVTTAKHVNYVRRAIPYGSRVFNVPLSTGSGNPVPRQQALDVLVAEVPALLRKAGRATKHKANALADVQDALADARDFAAFFGLPAPDFSGINEEDLESAAAQARIAYGQQRAEERDRQLLQREKDREAARPRLEQWLAGDPRAYVPNCFDEDYLRVVNEWVQTSRGAMVKAENVKRLAPLVLLMIDRAKERGNAVLPPVRTLIGHYELNRAEANGDVIVGCHRFEESEVRRFAAVIADWEPEPEEPFRPSEPCVMPVSAGPAW